MNTKMSSLFTSVPAFLGSTSEEHMLLSTRKPFAVLVVLVKNWFPCDYQILIRTIPHIIPHKIKLTWIKDSNIKAKLYKMLKNV